MHFAFCNILFCKRSCGLFRRPGGVCDCKAGWTLTINEGQRFSSTFSLTRGRSGAGRQQPQIHQANPHRVDGGRPPSFLPPSKIPRFAWSNTHHVDGDGPTPLPPPSKIPGFVRPNTHRVDGGGPLPLLPPSKIPRFVRPNVHRVDGGRPPPLLPPSTHFLEYSLEYFRKHSANASPTSKATA